MPEKKRERHIHTRKSQSLRTVSLRILLPIGIALLALLVCLGWGFLQNRELTNMYIADTAELYVEQINRDISQINNELIYILGRDRDIAAIPDEIGPKEGKYYSILRDLTEQNRVLKIRYSEVQFFFVYGQEADVLITDSGTIYSSSPVKGEVNGALMEFLKRDVPHNSQYTKWSLIRLGTDDYVVSWFSKSGKVMGCVMNLGTIFSHVQQSVSEYEVVPFMREPGGNILLPSINRDEYLEKILRGPKKADLYEYQLGTVGKLYLYIVPGGGIREGIYKMQFMIVFMLGALFCVCAVVSYVYYQRVMEPMRQFVQELNDADEEQLLNETSSNNLLELESASGKFKELLRKIQSLKIAIYEKELNWQRAELEYTQEQIKPHFFLNCLSLIHGIADAGGEKEILHITEVLSDYLRYIFRGSNRERKIAEEVAHVQSYVEIQKLRYGDEAFCFETILDGDVEECTVPSLLLQTLVENAIVHEVTLDTPIEISLYITIERYEDGEYLYICVSDTGKGFSEETLDAIEHDTPIIYNGRKHVGLQNVKRRLALLYGESASITLSNMDENYGAVVEVRVPKQRTL